jgi:hypothetical protein
MNALVYLYKHMHPGSGLTYHISVKGSFLILCHSLADHHAADAVRPDPVCVTCAGESVDQRPGMVFPKAYPRGRGGICLVAFDSPSQQKGVEERETPSRGRG